jgi:putative ABC transport system permease protein
MRGTVGAAHYHNLTYWQIGLAASLMLSSGLLSFLLKLDLGYKLLMSSVRMVAQLLLIGLVLQWVFEVNRWEVVLALATAMVLIAGLAAVQRVTRKSPGMWLSSVAAVWASSWLVMAIALTVIMPVDPWYNPRDTIPLLGMILGSSLSGISLGLERMGEELSSQRGQVETLLALGATRWEAARLPIQKAVRTGMIPTLNMMSIAGIVSLPGMMTGQLLADVPPVEAVKYQIVILFMVSAAAALGTVLVVLLTYRRLFNQDHQFLYGRLSERK